VKNGRQSCKQKQNINHTYMTVHAFSTRITEPAYEIKNPPPRKSPFPWEQSIYLSIRQLLYRSFFTGMDELNNSSMPLRQSRRFDYSSRVTQRAMTSLVVSGRGQSLTSSMSSSVRCQSFSLVMTSASLCVTWYVSRPSLSCSSLLTSRSPAWLASDSVPRRQRKRKGVYIGRLLISLSGTTEVSTGPSCKELPLFCLWPLAGTRFPPGESRGLSWPGCVPAYQDIMPANGHPSQY